MPNKSILEEVKQRIGEHIKNHKKFLKGRTDTGAMWRLSIYLEVLALINKLEEESANK